MKQNNQKTARLRPTKSQKQLPERNCLLALSGEQLFVQNEKRNVVVLPGSPVGYSLGLKCYSFAVVKDFANKHWTKNHRRCKRLSKVVVAVRQIFEWLANIAQAWKASTF